MSTPGTGGAHNWQANTVKIKLIEVLPGHLQIRQPNIEICNKISYNSDLRTIIASPISMKVRQQPS